MASDQRGLEMRADYEVPVAGGSWEHRGGDCKHHGDNVPFAKPYKSEQPYLCVKCMLAVALSMKLSNEASNAERV